MTVRLWSISRDWQGETCAVLACGPSLTREIADAVRAAGCKVIAVNNAGVDTKTSDKKIIPAFAPWADVLYAADSIWWHYNASSAHNFKGMKVTIAPKEFFQRPNINADVVFIGNGGMSGYDPRANYIRTGRNSGFQALTIAVKRGASRVLLCGFDMRKVKGVAHFFGDHHFRSGYTSQYGNWLKEFNRAAALFEKAGSKVINCTPGSALECFEKMKLEDALNGMQELRATAEEDFDQSCADENGNREVGAQSSTSSAAT